MRDKFGDHQGYCWICSEHPKFVRGMNRYFLVKHNHTSTFVDRIHAPMYKYGQYRCRECAPLDKLEKHYAKQGERKLVCVSSSTLNNWIKRSAANKNKHIPPRRLGMPRGRHSPQHEARHQGRIRPV